MINYLTRTIRGARAARIAFLGVLTIVLAAACDGDNLFEGRPGLGSGPPRVVTLTAPAQAAENARVDVRVRAVAPRGLVRVNVRFRGAMSNDQQFDVSPVSTDTVVIDASVDLPETLTDSVLRVEAYATDDSGAVSDIVTATIRIVDASAPSVTVGSTVSSASVGGFVDLNVSARDAFGLQRLGYALVSERGDTVLKAMVPFTGTARDTIFRLQLPPSLAPGNFTIVGVAENRASLRGVSAPLALTLVDLQAPVARILEPGDGESLPLRDSVRVRVHAADSSGIASIRIEGIAFRFFPDTTQNSPRVVKFPEVSVPLPQGPERPLTRDTVVFRYLKPNADSISEPVYFIAKVRDAFGNESVDTVRVTPGPRVVILNPATGTAARVGALLPVRVQAHDPTTGIDSVHIYLSGLRTDTLRFGGLNGTRDPVERSELINVGTQAGKLFVRAAVWNSQSVRGTTPSAVEINISDTQSGVPPKVRRVVTPPARIELADAIPIRVIANDVGGAGIVRLGAVVIAIPANESPAVPRDTFYFSGAFAQPRGGTPDTTFVLRLRDGPYSELMAARFPLDFTFQVHAFAVDAQGRCSASTQETDQDLACVDIGGGFWLAQGGAGRTYTSVAVIGTSVGLPAGSVIADALPDTMRHRLYLSNFARNQINVLQLPDLLAPGGAVRDTAFRAVPLPVGSQPWGLFLVPGTDAAGPDRLMVGNSGGTNISFVPTRVALNELKEAAAERILTPNEVLFEVKEGITNGLLKYTVKEFEFSDRPQFVAMDNARNILYSTKPTRATIEGTARLARPASGYEPTIIIPPRSTAIKEATDTWAIAHVDSIVVYAGTLGDQRVVIYDHLPGVTPRSPIQSDTTDIGNAILTVVERGSDIFVAGGSWNRAGVGFSDTTYVAYSKDLSHIAFGEGNVAPFGRILLWRAPTGGNTGQVSSTGTMDLISNAAEQVTGLSLNSNGQMGVARGIQSTYFFTNNVQNEGDLRLNGLFAAGVAGGAGGVALHQDHDDGSAGSNETTVAYIATSNRSVKIVDTFHYIERGEVFIRDNIVGQLRASKPLGGANTGIAAGSCNEVVTQLFGVSAANAVTIVNIRRRDIRNVDTGRPIC